MLISLLFLRFLYDHILHVDVTNIGSNNPIIWLWLLCYVCTCTYACTYNTFNGFVILALKNCTHFTCNLSYNGHLTALPPHSYKLVYALDLAGVLTTLTVNDNTLERQLTFIRLTLLCSHPWWQRFGSVTQFQGSWVGCKAVRSSTWLHKNVSYKHATFK